MRISSLGVASSKKARRYGSRREGRRDIGFPQGGELFPTPEIFSLSKDGNDNEFRLQLNEYYVADSAGAGKTYLACALGQSACRNGVSVRYFQIAKLLQKITYARADGSSPKFLEILAKTQLLVIDDWLRNPLTESQTPDLLEILEDRYGRASTMLATQIPVSDWHDRLGNATLSDAVMDRIIHNAYRLELRGESMRKRRSPLTHSGHRDI